MYINKGDFCDNCGSTIECDIGAPSGTIVLEGCEPMVWRHVDRDKSSACIMAKPYDDWNHRSQYNNVVRKMEEKDAEV